MTRLSRFFRLGMHDAEKRLAALTARAAVRDDVAVSIIQTSAAFAVCVSLQRRGARVVRGSHCVGCIQRWRAKWRAELPAARARALGWLLIVAATVHTGVNQTLGDVNGWLWLTVPGIAAVTGIVLLLGARQDVDTRTTV